MDKELGSAYSLKSLFSDDRRAVLKQILNASLAEAEGAYRQIYERHVPLAHFLRDLGIPLPNAIRTAAEFALNSLLRQAFASDEMDLEQVRRHLEEAHSGGILLEATTLEYTLRQTIERLFTRFIRDPRDLSLMQRLESIIEMARSLSFAVVLWTAQNMWYEVRRTIYGEVSQRGQQGDAEAACWLQHFRSLGEKLGIEVASLACLPVNDDCGASPTNGLPPANWQNNDDAVAAPHA
jgi:hypothetical protein